MRLALLALLALLTACAKIPDAVSHDPSVSPDEGPSEYLDVYAVLAAEHEARVAEVSDALAAVGLTSTAKGGYPAHCTLYLTMFPRAAEAAVVREVERLAGAGAPFGLTLEGLRETAGGWLFLDVD